MENCHSPSSVSLRNIPIFPDSETDGKDINASCISMTEEGTLPNDSNMIYFALVENVEAISAVLSSKRKTNASKELNIHVMVDCSFSSGQPQEIKKQFCNFTF
jgi:hypothetical protein